VQFRRGKGAPAVWITFVTSDDLESLKAKIADLKCITGEMRLEILRSASERRPYIEIAG
jgi:hypothetical protein